MKRNLLENLFYRLLDRPLISQWIFLFVLIAAEILTYFYQREDFTVIYILATLFFGMGFFAKPAWVHIMGVSFIVALRSLPDQLWEVETLIRWPIYLLTGWVASQLVYHYRRVRTNKIELVLALSKSLDARDKYTASHSENVARYAWKLAKALQLPEKECHAIYIGGLLHDIGKIGVPEHILKKASRLTQEENEVIQRHPEIGYETLRHISNFKANGVLDMVRFHHERYDGQGYPLQLQGEEIPLFARIVTLADSFDAMTSKRVYRDHAMDWSDAVLEIEKQSGKQFDPQLARLFAVIIRKEGSRVLSPGDVPKASKALELALANI